ncbi:flagellar protein FlgN [Salibacterium lacus]|uniref:Flagellar protein FlgN n=1 Tax=Salibacterium lacus TaxID=1898109 RepID=A0ABW5T2N7_9BACI
MSVKAIFETMARLVQQHKELNTMSARKTELIKSNQTKELAELLKQESRQIRAIEQTEKERQEAVDSYLKSREAGETEGTVSVLLQYLPEGHHEPLLQLQQGLLQEMASLRSKEALNRQMVEDSRQFVQMTLDMIQPDPEAVHYSHPDEQKPKKRDGFSIFDSKA